MSNFVSLLLWGRTFEEGIEAGWDIVFASFRDDIVIIYGIGWRFFGIRYVCRFKYRLLSWRGRLDTTHTFSWLRRRCSRGWNWRRWEWGEWPSSVWSRFETCSHEFCKFIRTPVLFLHSCIASLSPKHFHFTKLHAPLENYLRARRTPKHADIAKGRFSLVPLLYFADDNWFLRSFRPGGRTNAAGIIFKFETQGSRREQGLLVSTFHLLFVRISSPFSLCVFFSVFCPPTPLPLSSSKIAFGNIVTLALKTLCPTLTKRFRCHCGGREPYNITEEIDGLGAAAQPGI